MTDFVQALDTGVTNIGHFDAELHEVVVLSLGVSLSPIAVMEAQIRRVFLSAFIRRSRPGRRAKEPGCGRTDGRGNL
jgi:hypothetical protein